MDYPSDEQKLRARITELESQVRQLKEKRGSEAVASPSTPNLLQNYAEVLGKGPAFLYTIDWMHQRVLAISDSIQSFAGYSAEEVYGMESEFLSLFDMESRKSMVAHYSSPPPGGKIPPRQAMIRIRHKDGYWRDFQIWSCVGKYTEDGRIALIVGMGVDITDALATHKAWHKSEEQLRAIMNASSDAIILIDRDGMVLDINRNFAPFFKGARAEIIGSLLWDWIPEPILTQRRRAVERVFETGKSVRGVDEHDEQWTDFAVYPVFDEKLSCAHAAIFARNVTALVQSERNYQMLFDSMASGFALHEIICDAEGRPINYRYLAVNPAFETMVGLKADAILGQTVLEVLPDVEPEWIATFGKVAISGQPIRFESYTQTLDKYFEVSAYSPRPGQFACTFFDVTDRIQAQKSLKASEARFRSLFEQAVDGIFLIDETGRLRDMNRSACESLGYTHEELSQLKWTDVVLTTSQPSDPATLLTEIRSQGSILYEGQHKRKDGSEFPVETTISVMRENDDSESLLAISRDISSRKQYEEEQHKLEAQLRQSQKMEAIGQLAGGVAHDFNNLLLAIRGYTDLAMEDLPTDHAILSELAEVSKATDRATALVRQLLTFSRRQELTLATVDLNEIVTGLLKMIRRIIGEHIDLTFTGGSNLYTIAADPGQIEQVLVNLCVNARDAMPRGGKLYIETENFAVDPRYSRTHMDARIGDYVSLTISDTGEGIPQDIQSRIFEPFFTTKEVDRGTGLGLATVYAITKRHGGFLNLYSEYGHGTTFRIYFPQGTAGGSADRDDAVLKLDTDAPPATILLAEDDELVRKLSVRIMERAGFKVLVARDGAEAIELYDGHHEEISLALLDVIMPQISGRGVCEHIRARNPHLPILFASGYSYNVLHNELLPDQSYQVIPKPYQHKVLLSKIREALDTHKKR